jgi:hypothetical protein
MNQLVASFKGVRYIFFLLLITNMIGARCVAQKWLIEITPGFKYYSNSYYKTFGSSSNSAENTFSFGTYKRSARWVFEPELMIDVIKLNDKWKFGFGLSTYQWFRTVRVNATGQVMNIDSSLTDFKESISSNLNVRYSQFLLSATREFKTKTSLDNLLKNSLIIGLGINKPSSFNPKAETEQYVSVLNTSDGYTREISYTRNNTFGYLAPFLFVKFEMSILNKKKYTELLNVHLDYYQGLTNNYIFSMYSTNASGANVSVQTKSLGSGLRIGVSKTLRIEKKIRIPIAE